MQFLKSYELFESYTEKNFKIDSSYIDTWFSENYEYDEETYRYMSDITDFAEHYLDIIRNDKINNGEYENFDDEDIRKYLINELNFDEDDVNNVSNTDLYDKVPNDRKFFAYMWDEYYGEYDVKDYLNDMGYNDDEMFDVIESYIDYDKLDSYLKRFEDEYFIRDRFYDELSYNQELQEEIVDLDNFNAIILIDFLKGRYWEINNEYINSYNFQEIYINESLYLAFEDEKPNKIDYNNEMLNIFSKLDYKGIILNTSIKIDYENEYRKYKISIQSKKFKI